jgi:hypothetical protein
MAIELSSFRPLAAQDSQGVIHRDIKAGDSILDKTLWNSLTMRYDTAKFTIEMGKATIHS